MRQNIQSETAALQELQAICGKFPEIVRTGDRSRIQELNEFLDYTLVQLGAQGLGIE